MQIASIRTSQVFQELGTVVGTDGGLRVETASGRFAAVRAVSCLVEPALDDQVLVAVPLAGDLYVLAVLTRPSEEELRVRLDGDAAMECAGRLSILAADAIELRSPGEVSTIAAKVSTTSVEAIYSSERTTLLSRVVEAHADRVKGVLGMVDTVLERLSQRVKRSYRIVEELDLTRAKQVDIRAAETFNVRGRNTFMTAEELVKMQGEQIHLG